MNSTRMALVALFASSFVVGCAVDTGSEAGTENVASESEALGAPAAATSTIKGEWIAESGVLQKLELTNQFAQTVGGIRGKKFKGVVDTGIRCITTPCPSQADVSGVYTTTSNKLTLIAIDKPAQTLQKVLGDYRYELACDVLSLKKAGAGTAWIKFNRPVVTPPAVASCVTYKSIESTATTGAFYAINVPSRAAGQALLAERAAWITEGTVFEGACNQPMMCPQFTTRDGVCGEPIDDGKSKYQNACYFQEAVRNQAGTTGESKGKWTNGKCLAAEGEHCGGFTTPERQVTCDPKPVNGRVLTCVPSEATFDGPGTCLFN